MRAIKFRGYIKYPSDIISGFWYGDLIHYANGDIYIRQVETGTEQEVIPETVGQFTGLTDKNGVEIYEGDILSVKEFWNNGMPDFTYEDRDLFELNDLKGELHDKYITDIAYEPGCFVIKTGKEDYDCFASAFEGNQKHSQPIFDFEVIGNIHDNPELLQ